MIYVCMCLCFSVNQHVSGAQELHKKKRKCAIDYKYQDGSAYDGFSLHRAVMAGRMQTVESLIGEGAGVNASAHDGFTPLHVAAQQGNCQMVQLLLKHGAQPDKFAWINNENKTPLHVAAQYGYLAVVQFLLPYYAQADIFKSPGRTPLQVAVASGYKDIVGYLLEHGAKLDQSWMCWTPLLIAVSKNNISMVQFLLDRGADANFNGNEEFSLLELAASNGYREIVKLLLDYGASKIQGRVYSKDYNSPLLSAVNNRHYDVMKLLLERGIDVNQRRTCSGGTALHGAVHNGDIQAVGILLKVHGIDVTIKNCVGKTALDLSAGNLEIGELILSFMIQHDIKPEMPTLVKAIEDGNVLAVKYLLKNKADPNYRLTPTSDTPLCHAIAKNNTTIARLLVEYGANVDQLGAHGMTPLQLAVQQNRVPLVDLLFEYRANVNAIGNCSALTTAIISNATLETTAKLIDKGANPNYPEIVSCLTMALLLDKLPHAALLLAHGANPNIHDSSEIENTPLHAVATRTTSVIECVRFLLQHGANCTLRNKNGQIARDLALEKRNVECVYLLEIAQKQQCDLAKRAWKQQKGIMLAVVLHHRCGASSPLNGLNQSLVRKICNRAGRDYYDNNPDCITPIPHI